jgi:hypothetical protein
LARYFFRVMGGRLPIEDDEGTLFSDNSDAVVHASIIANDLATDRSISGLRRRSRGCLRERDCAGSDNLVNELKTMPLA